MAQLSWNIVEITESDYEWSDTTYKRVRPLFDWVLCNWFSKSFNTSTSDADCKTDVKAVLTTKWYTWDSEI